MAEMFADTARRRPALRPLIEKFAPLLALAILVVASAALSDSFLKPENLLNILRQVSFVGIIAVGMTFVIISGGIDLSVGSAVALLGAVGILAMNDVAARTGSPGMGVAAGVAVMMAGGILAGLLNGALIVYGRIAPFIATLGTMAAYRSVALALANGGEVRVGDPLTYEDPLRGLFQTFGTGGITLPLEVAAGVPLRLHYPVVALIVVAVLGMLVLRLTSFGVYVRAIGDNEKAAAYSAVRIGRVRLLTYSLIGLTSGVSAVLLSSRLSSVASSSTGLYYELDAIAAVVIGGTRMQGGSGWVFGTLVGVLILGVVNNMLNLVGVGPYYQGLVKGAIIIAAVLVQRAGRAA